MNVGAEGAEGVAHVKKVLAFLALSRRGGLPGRPPSTTAMPRKPRRTAEQVFRDTVRGGTAAVARWLRKNDVNKDLGDLYQYTTPLHVALRCGASDVAHALLAAGADVHARERLTQRSIRHHLGRRQRKAGGGYLPPNEGTTTLLQVAKKQPIDHDLLQRFLDAGVDLHAGGVWLYGTKKVASDGPVAAAARAADARALELLLAAGAETTPFHDPSMGRQTTLADEVLSPFGYAIPLENKIAALRVLLRRGVRPMDSEGGVLFALQADDAGLLRELLDPPDMPGSIRNPTHWLRVACRRYADQGARRCMQALVAWGAKPLFALRAPMPYAIPVALRADLRRWRTVYLWSRARVAARVRWVLTRWHEDSCAARYNLTKDDMEEEVADFNAAVAAVLAPRV